MNKRITSIALFDKQSLEKLEDITNTLDMKFCKVPYREEEREKYNPDTFIPHITIHCDKDYNKIEKIKNILNKNFKPFKVRFSEIGLFEIYPAVRIL